MIDIEKTRKEEQKEGAGTANSECGIKTDSYVSERSKTAILKDRKRQRGNPCTDGAQVLWLGCYSTHLRPAISIKLPTQRGSNGCM